MGELCKYDQHPYKKITQYTYNKYNYNDCLPDITNVFLFDTISRNTLYGDSNSNTLDIIYNNNY